MTGPERATNLANREPLCDISPVTGTLQAGGRRDPMAWHPRKPTTFALASLLLVAAACGGQAGTGSAAPSSAAAPSGAAPTTAAPAGTAKPATTAPTTLAPNATDQPLAALDLLWEETGTTEPTGQYPATYGPAVDPLTGDIWVAAPADDVLWVFSKYGEFKTTFGKPGDGRGEFELTRPACRDCPGAGALAFAPDGSLFVADVGNHRIQKFDPAHKFETEWGDFGAGESQFADANQLATNGREVFVSDDARKDTQVFDLDGTFQRVLPVSGWTAVDPAGTLFIVVEGVVHTFGDDGNELETIELPDRDGGFHIGLAIDARGRLYFGLQNDATGAAIALGELDPTTGESRFWSTAGETLVISGDVIYEANYTGPGWPDPVLRAYALPE